MSEPALRFVAWSDYLCPWCANASLRLYAIEDEFPEVEVEWRSYLLRPHPRPAPASELDATERAEKFRQYTRSWLRPAGEPDAAEFNVWQADTAPPSHSIPAHVVAKAAARLGTGAFRGLHEGLLRAYFQDNRDISAEAELRSVWCEAGLAPDAFVSPQDPALAAAVIADHQDAIGRGVSGVPAVMLVGNDAVIVGAQPLDVVRRWVERSLERLRSV